MYITSFHINWLIPWARYNITTSCNLRIFRALCLHSQSNHWNPLFIRNAKIHSAWTQFNLLIVLIIIVVWHFQFDETIFRRLRGACTFKEQTLPMEPKKNGKHYLNRLLLLLYVIWTKWAVSSLHANYQIQSKHTPHWVLARELSIKS